MEDSLAESFDGDEQEAAAADAPAAEPAHYPAIQISRRFTISVHMVWGLTCLLMLRAIPSFVMQTPDLKGMGDPGQILDRPFTNVEKATILAAWGWGYCGCQMPGGALSQRIGGKRTWLMAFMLSAITSFSIPTVGAIGGVYAIAAFNFLSGCGQAPLFPAMSGLQGAWIPQREWARASSLVGCMWSGGQMITKLAAPWVLMNWGWGWCYRVCAINIFIWAFFWNKYAYSTPDDDPHCTQEEKAYINAGRPPQKEKLHFDRDAYWVVFKQQNVLALTFLNFCQSLGGGWYNWFPLFLEQQQGFDLASTGAIFALVDFFSTVGSLLGGFFADWLMVSPRTQGTRYSTVNWIRRAAAVFRPITSAGMCLVFAASLPPSILIPCLFFYNVAGSFIGAAQGPIPQDISWKYAGAVQGVGNTGSNVGGYFLSTMLIGGFLDLGGCKGTDSGSPGQPEQFWAAAEADDQHCTVFSKSDVAGCVPKLRDPHLNYTCMMVVTPNDDEQECVLQHTLVKPDIMNAVEDPQACHSTWTWLYLLLAAVSLVGAIVFYFFGNALDVTEKIDREIAERRGNKASGVDREVDDVWAHAGNGSANGQGAAVADEAMQQEQDNPLANATSL